VGPNLSDLDYVHEICHISSVGKTVLYNSKEAQNHSFTYKVFSWQSAPSIISQTSFHCLFRQRIGDGKFPLQGGLSSTKLVCLRQGTICSTRQRILSILACQGPGCLCNYLHYHLIPGNTPEPNVASTTGPKSASGHSWNAFR
jgi:hypothetical protein